MRPLFMGQVTLSLRQESGLFQTIKYVVMGHDLEAVVQGATPTWTGTLPQTEGEQGVPPYRVLSIVIDVDCLTSEAAQLLARQSIIRDAYDVGLGVMIPGFAAANLPHATCGDEDRVSGASKPGKGGNG